MSTVLCLRNPGFLKSKKMREKLNAQQRTTKKSPGILLMYMFTKIYMYLFLVNYKYKFVCKSLHTLSQILYTMTIHFLKHLYLLHMHICIVILYLLNLNILFYILFLHISDVPIFVMKVWWLFHADLFFFSLLHTTDFVFNSFHFRNQ